MNGVLLFLAAWAGILPAPQGTHASTVRLLSGEVRLSREATASTRTSAALEFFVVNTSDDVDDGSCDLIHCSMREAIHAANASPGLDDIEIVRDVFPLSPLPHLVDPVNNRDHPVAVRRFGCSRRRSDTRDGFGDAAASRHGAGSPSGDFPPDIQCR